MSSAIFCDNCGALNPAGAPFCDQCRAPLTAGAVPDDGGFARASADDDFQVLGAGAPPAAPGSGAGRRAPPVAANPDFANIPVAPRRGSGAPAQQQQSPGIPAITLPRGLPKLPGARLPTGQAPKLPGLTPAQVPGKAPGMLGKLFKGSAPAPAAAPARTPYTGRREGAPAVPQAAVPKWLIALVVVLAASLGLFICAFMFRLPPLFNDAAATQTAVAEKTVVASYAQSTGTAYAAIFITQTITAQANETAADLAQKTSTAVAAAAAAQATATHIGELEAELTQSRIEVAAAGGTHTAEQSATAIAIQQTTATAAAAGTAAASATHQARTATAATATAGAGATQSAAAAAAASTAGAAAQATTVTLALQVTAGVLKATMQAGDDATKTALAPSPTSPAPPPNPLSDLNPVLVRPVAQAMPRPLFLFVADPQADRAAAQRRPGGAPTVSPAWAPIRQAVERFLRSRLRPQP